MASLSSDSLFSKSSSSSTFRVRLFETRSHVLHRRPAEAAAAASRPPQWRRRHYSGEAPLRSLCSELPSFCSHIDTEALCSSWPWRQCRAAPRGRITPGQLFWLDPQEAPPPAAAALLIFTRFVLEIRDRAVEGRGLEGRAGAGNQGGGGYSLATARAQHAVCCLLVHL